MVAVELVDAPDAVGRVGLRLARFAEGRAEANARLLTPLTEAAEAHGATPGQVALAWVRQRADVWGLPVVPIPGTKKVHRLEENAASVDVCPTGPELDALDAIAAAVEGDRYPDMTLTSAGPRAQALM
ncbi:aldo/keto reductase [Nocardiopsis ganjiahuensis]|uniref:aldo/keto reductase n=1 Tax=Nocardiopsis ganjiahuensis TaxID=239984 RepID=UPI00036752D0|nr:aldo/keto reductase [Nocardiopsis ganjiahuensis]